MCIDSPGCQPGIRTCTAVWLSRRRGLLAAHVPSKMSTACGQVAKLWSIEDFITCILALIGSLLGLVLRVRAPLPGPACLIVHRGVARHLRQPLRPLLSRQLPRPARQKASLSCNACNMPAGNSGPDWILSQLCLTGPLCHSDRDGAAVPKTLRMCQSLQAFDWIWQGGWSCW